MPEAPEPGEATELTAEAIGGPLGIAIVGARFNEAITDTMVQRAQERVAKLGHELVTTVRVPGAFDTPLPAHRLAQREDVDGVVVLGAVVTGETDHDQVLMHTTARTLQEVSVTTGKPVVFGITGPGMSYSQAKARVHYAARAVDAAVEVHLAADRISEGDPGA